MHKVLVTGGCGFIGSAVCRHLVLDLGWQVVNLDKLTYASTPGSTAVLAGNANYSFYQGDVRDQEFVLGVLRKEAVTGIIHLAAESHVDRSIDGPAAFVETNILGTFELLQAARRYWEENKSTIGESFRFHHVSTDEVFGDLPLDESLFTEHTAYDPSSPYSATKAASDHLVRAWYKTFGLPIVLSNCSNNYGTYHFPEKLIPLMIINGIEGKDLPVYGTGENVRDWLYVDDHAAAIALIFKSGVTGSSYNVGGRNERSNIQVVETIADILDEMLPVEGLRRRSLMRFVTDRPGHDLRYAIDASKLENELGWRARDDFESGLRKTIAWYIGNDNWWRPLRDAKYKGARLGLKVEKT